MNIDIFFSFLGLTIFCGTRKVMNNNSHAQIGELGNGTVFVSGGGEPQKNNRV
jgi:hypothetical protein